MPKLHYMSIIYIFYLFWYFDVFCEECAYLSLKRELKNEVGNLELQVATGDCRNTSDNHRRLATINLQRSASEIFAWNEDTHGDRRGRCGDRHPRVREFRPMFGD